MRVHNQHYIRREKIRQGDTGFYNPFTSFDKPVTTRIRVRSMLGSSRNSGGSV